MPALIFLFLFFELNKHCHTCKHICVNGNGRSCARLTAKSPERKQARGVVGAVNGLNGVVLILIPLFGLVRFWSHVNGLEIDQMMVSKWDMAMWAHVLSSGVSGSVTGVWMMFASGVVMWS